MSPRRGLTPEAVTEAALAVADADGLEAVTIARVAADLGVRAPSLYNHVASRDELLRAVTLRAGAELETCMRDAVLGRSGDEALVALLHAYRDYVRTYPARGVAVMRAPAADDAEYAAAGERMIDVFRAALRSRQLAPEDEVHAIRALRATVVGFTALETEGGYAMPVSTDTSFGVLVRAVVDGLTSPTAGLTSGGR